jgi:hypothetical protein
MVILLASDHFSESSGPAGSSSLSRADLVRDSIENKFGKFPAQKKVVKLLFERGFCVTAAGKVTSGNIEIPHVQIGNEIGVDRRVVDTAAGKIAEDPELFTVFQHLHSVCFLRDAAPYLGLGVIVIVPEDSAGIGIIAGVTKVISDAGFSIRQAVSDDPYFTPEPRLTIITNEPLPGNVVDAVRKTSGVKGVSLY